MYAAFRAYPRMFVNGGLEIAKKIRNNFAAFDSGKDSSPPINPLLLEIAEIPALDLCPSEPPDVASSLSLNSELQLGLPAGADAGRTTKQEKRRRQQSAKRARDAVAKEEESARAVRQRLETAKPVPVNVKANIPRTKTGWTGPRSFDRAWASTRPHTLDEVKRLPGFAPQVVKWDGM